MIIMKKTPKLMDEVKYVKGDMNENAMIHDPYFNAQMSENIIDYIRIYSNVIDEKSCKKFCKKLDKSKLWTTHAYYDTVRKENVVYEDELECIFDYGLEQELVDFSKDLTDKLWHVLNCYINTDIKLPWFNSWQGYSPIRYNRYNIKSKMRLHCDHITTIFDGERKGIPTLTILGSLNNDYEGGELVLMNNRICELKAGSVVIFPSIFLFPHLVRPVTKGRRYSFVSWVW
jgi:hypothetical protein